MTALQQCIMKALDTLGGSGTAKEIADLLGTSPRAVATSLMFLRGEGQVHDGSTHKPIMENGQQVALLWSPGPKPIKWTKR